MPLNSSTLATQITNAITGLSAQDKESVQTIWNAIAQQIVLHIQANAIVTVAAGIPVSTAGSAAAQTGATTAPGTGTIQ